MLGPYADNDVLSYNLYHINTAGLKKLKEKYPGILNKYYIPNASDSENEDRIITFNEQDDKYDRGNVLGRLRAAFGENQFKQPIKN